MRSGEVGRQRRGGGPGEDALRVGGRRETGTGCEWEEEGERRWVVGPAVEVWIYIDKKCGSWYRIEI